MEEATRYNAKNIHIEHPGETAEEDRPPSSNRAERHESRGSCRVGCRAPQGRQPDPDPFVRPGARRPMAPRFAAAPAISDREHGYEEDATTSAEQDQQWRTAPLDACRTGKMERSQVVLSRKRRPRLSTIAYRSDRFGPRRSNSKRPAAVERDRRATLKYAFRSVFTFLTGWRRERDSNPRYGFPYTHFPGVRLQPLGHPSSRSAPLLKWASVAGAL